MKEAPGLALAPPPDNPRFPLLDGMRGVATLTVVVFHVGLTAKVLGPEGWHQWLATMTFGPQMFFMFSGFLIYRPFVSSRVYGTRRPKVGKYARRRALRILPGYWVALTLLAVYPGVNTDVLSGDFWLYYGLVHTYFEGHVVGGLGLSWTLCTEVSFYALLPLIAGGAAALAGRVGVLRARRMEVGALLLVIGSSYLWTRYWRQAGTFEEMDYARTLWLPGTAAFFAVGMLFAIVTCPLPGERPVRDRIPNWLAFSLTCFGLALFVYWLRMQIELDAAEMVMLNGLLSALALAPAIFARDTDRGPERILGHPWMAWLGLVAYGIYLYHGPIMHEIGAHGIGDGSAAGFLLLLGVVTAAATVLGTLSYYFVEAPALRFKEGRRTSPQPEPVAAPEPATSA